MTDELFSDDDVVFTYTSKQATADGILFDITQVNSHWEQGLFSHITMNLLVSAGYMVDDEINIPNLLDLLNQALEIVHRKSDNFTQSDWFFEGEIELPSGTKQQVFICQNETGKYTLMLPEDY